MLPRSHVPPITEKQVSSYSPKQVNGSDDTGDDKADDQQREYDAPPVVAIRVGQILQQTEKFPDHRSEAAPLSYSPSLKCSSKRNTGPKDVGAAHPPHPTSLRT